MPFEFKKLANHSAGNPVVARLSMQTLDLLRQTKADKAVTDAVGELYTNSLMKKLLRCWEIEDAFKKSFEKGEAEYKPPEKPNQPVHIPQIDSLEENAHNFLYESKNYIRDFLQVVNKLYGTEFQEASEFSKPRGGRKSLVQFAEEKFGAEDWRTKWLKDAVPLIDEVIAMRNAVEHPEGHSGKLVIENFRRGPNQMLVEPTWHRVKGGQNVTEPSSIRTDYRTIIEGLLDLGDDLVAAWVQENLASDMMEVGYIPEDQRDPNAPVKFKVGPSAKLLRAIQKNAPKG